MKIKDANCFLLDMDGTLFLGEQLIDGAKEFLEKLDKKKIEKIFLTNNSSKNKYYYKDKFLKNGIKVELETILTSGEATALFIKKKFPNLKIYIMGSEYLKEDFLNYKLNIVAENETPGIVVLGSDYDINYKKIFHACNSISNGAKFIMTHPDIIIPIENKMYLPDAGAIGKMIESATGEIPLVIGKPNKLLSDLVIQKFKLEKKNIIMVGDLLETDIQFAINSKINSILVLSGGTTKEKLRYSNIKPDFIFESVKDIIQEL